MLEFDDCTESAIRAMYGALKELAINPKVHPRERTLILKALEKIEREYREMIRELIAPNALAA